MSIEKDVEDPHSSAAVPEIPGGGQRPPCGRIHHRLPAHDGLGQPECPRDREPDGQRDRHPPRRRVCGGGGDQPPGWRPAGLRHRGGRAGGGEHHGLGGPAAGGAGRHDRLGPGGYLPGHLAGLWLRGAAGRSAGAEGRRLRQGTPVHQDHAAGLDAGLCPAGGHRIRTQGALFG